MRRHAAEFGTSVSPVSALRSVHPVHSGPLPRATCSRRWSPESATLPRYENDTFAHVANRTPSALLEERPWVGGDVGPNLGQVEDAVKGVREHHIREAEPPVLRDRLRVEDEADLKSSGGVRSSPHEALGARFHLQPLLKDVRTVDFHEPDHAPRPSP